MNGLIVLPWWGYIVLVLILTHITIVSVTLYLHRGQAHKTVEFHPVVSHFFRFWLWLTTGMNTKAWTAIHRKHHAFCETEDDPHSPKILGLNKVLWEGAELYKKEAKNLDTLSRYGVGTPDDWMERKVYTPHSVVGVSLLLVVCLLLFGTIGLSVWAAVMLWIPFFAAGIINGVAHYFGYRTFASPDQSHNLFPIGIFVGGEELHNNHHSYPVSAKFSQRWYEFDLGWMYIKILSFLKLATIKRVSSKIIMSKHEFVSYKTLQAIIAHRYHILHKFNQYTKILYIEEMLRIARLNKCSVDSIPHWTKVREWVISDKTVLSTGQRMLFEHVLKQSPKIKKINTLHHQLKDVWTKQVIESKQQIEQLRDWCHFAETSGIGKMKDFSQYVQRFGQDYSLE